MVTKKSDNIIYKVNKVDINYFEDIEVDEVTKKIVESDNAYTIWNLYEILYNIF